MNLNMSDSVDIKELQSRLHAHDLKIQVAGISEAKRIIDAIVESAVQGLSKTDNVTIFADRLSTLGPAIVPELEKVYQHTGNQEVRTTAAILLLHFGSRLGLSDVIDTLSVDNPNQFIAATKLAAAGVGEAVQPILMLLKAHVFERPLEDQSAPGLAALIAALEKLKINIPDDIRKRLTAPGVSSFISALMNK
jgi:hypothetical protein